MLDARAAARYRGEKEPIDPVAGHIPTALSLPFADNLQEDGRWRSAAELRARFEEHTEGEKPVVVYCGSGVTACHLLLAIHMAELTPAHLYPGSWSDWITDTTRPIE